MAKRVLTIEGGQVFVMRFSEALQAVMWAMLVRTFT